MYNITHKLKFDKYVKGGPKKCDVFFGCLFRQTYNVDILETVCSNDLKEHVVLRTNIHQEMEGCIYNQSLM